MRQKIEKVEEVRFSDEIIDLKFREHAYRAYKHDFFRHPNEIESRNRHLTVPQGTVMVDVGAACGTWTLPGSFLAKKVYAFEPFTGLALEILRNKTLNDIDNIFVMNAMVLDATSPSRHIECATGDANGYYLHYSSLVPAVTLDDFMSQRPDEKVGFIKIDVEGAEMSVLRGAREVIKRDHPNVMVEIHTTYGVPIDSVVNFFTWISPHYTCAIMPQTFPSEYLIPCSVFGQTPAGHVHALFSVREPECPEFIEVFRRP